MIRTLFHRKPVPVPQRNAFTLRDILPDPGMDCQSASIWRRLGWV